MEKDVKIEEVCANFKVGEKIFEQKIDENAYKSENYKWKFGDKGQG